jgi:hypothetical protein
MWATYTPFCCCLLAHLRYCEEVTKGLNMMKFAINHPMVFKSRFAPFVIGFFLAFNVFYMELLAIYVLCASGNVMNTLAQFVVIMILI